MSRFMRLPEVLRCTGLSRTSVYRKASDPGDPFPSAVRLGESAVGWWESDIETWMETRPVVLT